MKSLKIIIGTLLLTAGASGCTSSLYSAAGTAVSDDLYATHDKVQIAREQQSAAETRKAEAEARKAEWDARVAEARALAAEQGFYSEDLGTGNSYEDVLADDYQSAYARRLRGFQSSSYRMPSSYYNFRYGDAFNYVSAYDPAFYNIVISGDQVWVEPKYVTSMFGSWGASIYNNGWYSGWSFGPSSGWGYPNYAWNNWNWGLGYNPWYNPWYYDRWWGHGWHNHWGYQRPHNYYRDGSSGRGYSSSSGRGGYNSGRSYNSNGSGYNSGRGTSYNNNSGYNSGRGSSNSGRGSYNSGRGSSNSGSSYNSGRGTSNNSGSSYNSGRGSSSYGGSSGSSGGGYSGGSSSGSSGGGRSYNSGR